MNATVALSTLCHIPSTVRAKLAKIPDYALRLIETGKRKRTLACPFMFYSDENQSPCVIVHDYPAIFRIWALALLSAMLYASCSIAWRSARTSAFAGVRNKDVVFSTNLKFPS